MSIIAHKERAPDTPAVAWLRRRLARAAVFLAASLLATAASAAGLLWEFDDTGQPGIAGIEGAGQRHAITLDDRMAQGLQAGDGLRVQMPGGVRTYIVTSVTDYINGDVSIRALSADGGEDVTLTLGRRAAFASISRDGAAADWQLDVFRDSDGSPLRGWLYRPDAHSAAAPQRDYVIPGRPSAPSPRTAPLMLNHAAGPGSAPELSAVAAPVRNAQTEVDQHFERGAVVAGEQMETTLTVTLRNRTATARWMPALDIYFLLEDMTLTAQPPTGCAAQTLRQPGSADQRIMRCELSSRLAAGASREFTFRLRAGPVEEPGTRLWSTVQVDGLRHDAAVNVVADVTTDSAGRGISDFNAALINRTHLDPRGDVVIDVLALYTPQADALYAGQARTRINQLFSVANRIYRDSGVGISLRPVRHVPVDKPAGIDDMDTLLRRLTQGDHPAFSAVDALRETYGADLVILFQPRGGAQGRCGLANLGGYQTAGDLTHFNDREYAYSLVAIDCPVDSVVAHETGHNMGLTHSHAQDGRGGTFTYATGHGEEGGFVTVMADPAYFGGATRRALFSSPLLDCGGAACGVDHREPLGADAVRSLNTVRFQVANYHETRVPPLPGRRVASADGSSTATRIGLAATTDGGLSYAQEVTPADTLDIRAELYIDEAHVGRQAVFHVLIDADGELYQLTEGGVVPGWNGEADGLLAYGEPVTLADRQGLFLLEQFRPPAELAGARLNIYLAYRLLGGQGSALIYTLESLRLDVLPSP